MLIVADKSISSDDHADREAERAAAIAKVARKLRQLIFVFSFVPFAIIISILLGQWLYYFSISNGIYLDPINHMSDVKSTVLKYSDQFAPSEVNYTKSGQISGKMAAQIDTTAAAILSKISSQFFYSFLLCLAVGGSWTFYRVRLAPKDPGKTIELSKRWVDSGLSGSSAVTASVSVGLTIIGAVSLISPSIVGGYVLAGLEILLMCVIVGIVVQYNSGSIDETQHQDPNKVIVCRGNIALWDTSISVQFVLLLLGIGLIVAQIFFFVK